MNLVYRPIDGPEADEGCHGPYGRIGVNFACLGCNTRVFTGHVACQAFEAGVIQRHHYSPLR